MPEFEDIEQYNADLLETCLELDADKEHYKKGVPQKELFAEDLLAMHDFWRPFTAMRFQEYKTDKYGKVTVEGNHTYMVRPSLNQTRVIVGFGAHWVEVYSKTGQLLNRHRRCFGSKRTDSTDVESQLELLATRSGAWMQSQVRPVVSEPLRSYMDNLSKADRRTVLRAMHDITGVHGLDIALQALESVFRNRGFVVPDDAMVLAGRMCGYGLQTKPEQGPELTAYDAFMRPPKEVHHA